MNTTGSIPTQPEPEHLAHAGDLLEAILLGRLNLDARLSVGAALAVLYDVFPPYAPRPAITEPLALRIGLQKALAALSAAVDAAGSVQEALRAGSVARELRVLLQRS